jgi:hypothetical protein
MKLCKLLLAAAGATVLLGALVSSASAGRLSVSNQSISAMWSTVTFTGPFGATRCHVTLEGTLHSATMVKTVGSLIGYITRAILNICEAGAATILTETLPWHIRYSGFQGTLPEITSLIVHVIGGAFRIREPGGITCLATTTAAQPGIGTFHRSLGSHALFGPTIGGRIRTGAECFGAEGTLESVSGQISRSGTGLDILVSLI